CLNTCVGLSSELFDPSPKSHSEVNESPSGSVDLFVKDTVRGAGPLLGSVRKSAIVGRLSRVVRLVVVGRASFVVVVTGVPTFTLSILCLDAAPCASLSFPTRRSSDLCLNTCVGLSSELFDPSPKSHSEVNESPSGSVDLLVKVTVRGAGPLLGAVRKSAIGERFSRVVLVVEDRRVVAEVGGIGGAACTGARLGEETAPWESVTTRLTWKVPARLYVCVGSCEELCEPSPKSHSEVKESPSASEDLLVKVTASGARPLLGLSRKSARGA